MSIGTRWRRRRWQTHVPTQTADAPYLEASVVNLLTFEQIRKANSRKCCRKAGSRMNAARSNDLNWPSSQRRDLSLHRLDSSRYEETERDLSSVAAGLACFGSKSALARLASRGLN